MNLLLNAYKINTDNLPVWVFANNEGKARQTALKLYPSAHLGDTADVITVSQALFKQIAVDKVVYNADGECIGYSSQQLAPIPDDVASMDDDDVLLHLFEDKPPRKKPLRIGRAKPCTNYELLYKERIDNVITLLREGWWESHRFSRKDHYPIAGSYFVVVKPNQQVLVCYVAGLDMESGRCLVVYSNGTECDMLVTSLIRLLYKHGYNITESF